MQWSWQQTICVTDAMIPIRMLTYTRLFKHLINLFNPNLDLAVCRLHAGENAHTPITINSTTLKHKISETGLLYTILIPDPPEDPYRLSWVAICTDVEEAVSSARVESHWRESEERFEMAEWPVNGMGQDRRLLYPSSIAVIIIGYIRMNPCKHILILNPRIKQSSNFTRASHHLFYAWLIITDIRRTPRYHRIDRMPIINEKENCLMARVDRDITLEITFRMP